MEQKQDILIGRDAELKYLESIESSKEAEFVVVYGRTHKPVHDELTEHVAIVTVNDVCQTNHHFKIIYVNVPVRAIGEQTERTMCILPTCDTLGVNMTHRCVRNIASAIDEYSNDGRCYILRHVETYSRSNRQHLTCFLRKVNVYQAFGRFLKPQQLT